MFRLDIQIDTQKHTKQSVCKVTTKYHREFRCGLQASIRQGKGGEKFPLVQTPTWLRQTGRKVLGWLSAGARSPHVTYSIVLVQKITRGGGIAAGRDGRGRGPATNRWGGTLKAAVALPAGGGAGARTARHRLQVGVTSDATLQLLGALFRRLLLLLN